MINPTFEQRISRERKSKLRIEAGGAFVHLLALLQARVILHTDVQIVRLHEREVSVAVLGRLARNLLLFRGRELCLQSAGDFGSQVGLDFENVAQVAIVILRPNMLIVRRVD